MSKVKCQNFYCAYNYGAVECGLLMNGLASELVIDACGQCASYTAEDEEVFDSMDELGDELDEEE